MLTRAVGLTPAIAAGALLAVAGCGAAKPASEQSAPRQQTAGSATIDWPGDGLSTAGRTVVVSGAGIPGADPDDEIVTLRVNRRPIDATPGSTNRYRVSVVLDLGVNRITLKAETYRGDDFSKPTASAAAGPVVVTRTPGAQTGVLDLATAYLVTEWSDDFYWLCGESEDCGRQTVCLSAGRRRVDCVVGTFSFEDSVRRCALVMSVRLRGPRVFFAPYGCAGRLKPNVRRHLRPDVFRIGKRFRIDDARDEYERADVNDSSRYGVPRFDIDRDVFVP
jgi:hypothetical protein